MKRRESVFNPNRCLILDGAMGTMLQKSGLRPGQHPDCLSLSAPQTVEAINRLYAEAGADLICSNTFGANRKKLADSGTPVEKVVAAGIACAKRACAGTHARVMLDIGPIGELLEPAGTLSFEEAYDIFRQVVLAGRDAGADAVLLETMTDLYELKAAILAARENTDLPVLASMSFEETGRTFTGCCVEAFAAVAQGLGVDGIGINCSLGPKEIYPLAQRLCRCVDIPVFIKPNAGLPDPTTGDYGISPDEFCEQMLPYAALGVAAVGGCCGTTPDYIRALRARFGRRKKAEKSSGLTGIVCTPTRVVCTDAVTVIGERINPTGKARFKEALRQGDMDYIMAQAVEQANAGAHVLDVNVGLPGVDEAAMMRRVVKAIQSVTDLPLQLDSTRADVLEAGLRVYNGKPIVNSVNAQPQVMENIFPLCRRYGAAVVGLTLDEDGIPEKAEQRFALAQRIVYEAERYGIPKEDVYIDCLTLTAGVQQASVRETLRAVRMVKEKLGVRTVLGVSNISFGLPCREQLNACFLTMALEHGLDMPILNPNSRTMMAATDAFRVLYGLDAGATDYIAHYTDAPQNAAMGADAPDLRSAVLQGLKQAARRAAEHELEKHSPEELVEQVLIPALDVVGERFEKGTLFLPQLLQAAGAAQAAFDVVKERICASGMKKTGKGTIVVATVQGDIHDIGKNIVKVILENYGYHVIDLGRDVPPAAVVEAVRKHKARLVGLSALMTTTLGSMEQTIRALREENLPCRIMVGGAVLTPEYARAIGADYYAQDAKRSVDIAREVLQRKEPLA